MVKVGRYAKAITAGVAAGSAALVTAMGDDVIVTGEWVTVALAVIGALGITYAVPNSAGTRTGGYHPGGHAGKDLRGL